MRSPHSHATSPSASRPEAWRDFLVTLAEQLVAAGVADSPPLLVGETRLVWRRGSHVDHVELRRYSKTPGVVRITVNWWEYRPPRATLLALGVPLFPRPPTRTPDLGLEWTALDGELVALARWLPSFLAARLDPEHPLTPPPVPSFGSPDLARCTYAWTVAAWRADAKVAGRPADLPRRDRLLTVA